MEDDLAIIFIGIICWNSIKQIETWNGMLGRFVQN